MAFVQAPRKGGLFIFNALTWNIQRAYQLRHTSGGSDEMDGLPPEVGGAPGGASGAGAPVLPKSPVGGPNGPGASPMLSPGGGAGNRAAATQQVKSVIPALLIASMAFESGSKEQQALLRAIQSLNPIFGKAEGANMVPAGLASMARAAKQGPMTAAPPPGLAPDASKPPPGMAAAVPPEGGVSA